MRRHDRKDGDETLWHLEAELGPLDRTPPPERVAAIRAAAMVRRTAAADSLEPRRTLRRRTFLAAGLGTAAGAAGGVLGYRLTEDRLPRVPTEPIALSGAPAGVSASAELINHTWGVELLLTASGLDAGRTYQVTYRTIAGDAVSAGSFVGVEAEFLCRMTGSVLRENVESIEVLDEDGAVVLRSLL